ncbi:MAG: hypothetical protein H8Z69_05735 [Nanohaloarchaea archaeon]|nr:hypothetical protein [Candidatus Nanohaloarchaea archaeon]
MGQLYYNVSPGDVQRLCSLVSRGYDKQSEITSDGHFRSSELSKAVGIARVFGLINNGSTPLELTTRGKEILKSDSRNDAYRKGIEDDDLYSKIIDEVIDVASKGNGAVPKSRIATILEKYSDQDLSSNSLGYAARDAMKFFEAAGYGEYRRVPGKKSSFEVYSDLMEDRDDQAEVENAPIENAVIQLRGDARIDVDRKEDKTTIEIPRSDFDISELSKVVSKIEKTAED